MNLQINFCFICLKEDESLQGLLENQINNETNYARLTSLIPEMIFSELKQYGMICSVCCVKLNELYNFREQCLNNKQVFMDRVKQLIMFTDTSHDYSSHFIDIKDLKQTEEDIAEEKCSIECSVTNLNQEVTDENDPLTFVTVKMEAQENECCEGKDSTDCKTSCNHLPKTNPNASFSIKEEKDIEPENVEVTDNIKNAVPGTSHCKTVCPRELDLSLPHTSLPNCGNIFVCKECGKMSRCLATLREHQKIHQFECNQCGKIYLKLSELETHKKNHGAKPYKCNECEMAFSLSANLKRHQRMHTDERPYKCDTCGKAFRRQEGKIKHERTHTGIKRYICKECGKAFLNQSCLTRHNRVHTGIKPFKCEQCGVAFCRRSNLRIHNRIHTGEKPYKCDECGYCFTRMEHLRRHLKTHETEKLHKCERCGEVFSHIGRLEKHKLIHIAEDMN